MYIICIIASCSHGIEALAIRRAIRFVRIVLVATTKKVYVIGAH